MSGPSLDASQATRTDVFISYRRNEASYLAGWLHDCLAARLGRERVFLDIDAIRPGVDFMHAITTAIARTRLMLVLIGPRWLRNDAGQLRLDDADDPVRREVESAIAAGVTIVPLLLDGARMPAATDLPPSLGPLVTRNAVSVTYGTFRRDVDELLRAYGEVGPDTSDGRVLDDRPPEQADPARGGGTLPPEQEREQRRRLLQRLSRTYEDHLGQSLDDERVVRMPLQLRWAPAQVRRPLETLLPDDRHQEVLAADDKPLLRVFDDTGGLDGDGFLVLGEPGAGKSTALVELCAALTRRALDDPTHPVPVYLPLQGWTGRRQSMTSWLVRLIDELYGVPPALGRRWTSGSELLFLFDGLDELARGDLRAACVAEINRFQRFGRERRLPSVVASRQYEYGVLTERLELENAVTVLPLQPERVLRDLVEAGSRMGGVLGAVRDDEALRELCTSPLLVSLLTLTYADDDRAPVLAPDVADRRRELFTSYVARRFVVERRGRTTGRSNAYPPAATIRWLSWLASTMANDHLPAFVLGRLDRRAVAGPVGRWMVAVLPAVLFGVVVGGKTLLFGLPGAALEYLVTVVFGAALAIRMQPGPTSADGPTWSWSALRARAPTAVVAALGIAVVFGLIENAFPGDQDAPGQSPVYLARGLALFAAIGVATVALGGLTLGDRTSGRWRPARPELASALLVGTVLGLAGGTARTVSSGVALGSRVSVTWAIFSGIGAWLATASGPAEHMSWSWRRATAHLPRLFGLSLTVGAVATVGFAVYAGLPDGLVVGSLVAPTATVAALAAAGVDRTVIPVHVAPNEATRRSFAHGMVVGGVTFAVVGVLAAWSESALTGPDRIAALFLGMLTGAEIGAALALAFGVGAAAQHWLVRVLLWQNGVAPLRLQRWLGYAVSLRLLYRSAGGGYVFIHRLLQDHFVEQGTATTAR